jgi:hypothetical protein
VEACGSLGEPLTEAYEVARSQKQRKILPSLWRPRTRRGFEVEENGATGLRVERVEYVASTGDELGF